MSHNADCNKFHDPHQIFWEAKTANILYSWSILYTVHTILRNTVKHFHFRFLTSFLSGNLISWIHSSQEHVRRGQRSSVSQVLVSFRVIISHDVLCLSVMVFHRLWPLIVPVNISASHAQQRQNKQVKTKRKLTIAKAIVHNSIYTVSILV